jgi:dihydrofolate reductase
MGKIVVTEFVSLDGVVEDPGGSESFKHGGWTFEISRGDEGDEFKLDELREAEAQLLGRVTYEGFAAAWPKMTDLGDFAEEISKLKEEVDGVILVAGSATLVQGLLEHGLVNEIRLMVFPVVLGSGKRLFGETPDKAPLKLIDSRTLGDGIALLTYEPTSE